MQTGEMFVTRGPWTLGWKLDSRTGDPAAFSFGSDTGIVIAETDEDSYVRVLIDSTDCIIHRASIRHNADR